ncbi:MAG TPA: hypothetical protein VGJ00_00315 [Rhabdochlamydiaceae bacterium]|jgi:hypothetical protein
MLLVLFSLISLVRCLTLEGAHSCPSGYAIEYQATISSAKIWKDFAGGEDYLFTLSDGTRWITNSADGFQTVIQKNWMVGDCITITLSDTGWIAKNAQHPSEITLSQICNKPGTNECN